MFSPFSSLTRGAAVFGTPMDFGAITSRWPHLANSEGFIDATKRAEILQRMREKQARNNAMAAALPSPRNSPRNTHREGLSLAQVEAEAQKLQRRRAALNAGSPRHQTMEDVRNTIQRIEGKQEERYQAEHKYDHLFPELRQMPYVAVDELRAPKPHQKPASRVSWNLGPRSSGSGF